METEVEGDLSFLFTSSSNASPQRNFSVRQVQNYLIKRKIDKTYIYFYFFYFLAESLINTILLVPFHANLVSTCSGSLKPPDFKATPVKLTKMTAKPAGTTEIFRKQFLYVGLAIFFIFSLITIFVLNGKCQEVAQAQVRAKADTLWVKL